MYLNTDEDEWRSDIESDTEDNEDNDLDSGYEFTDAKGAPGLGVMPPSPQPKPAETKEPESDHCDAGHSQDTGNLLLSKFDMVPINCPNDCLLVYPVMSGRSMLISLGTTLIMVL